MGVKKLVAYADSLQFFMPLQRKNRIYLTAKFEAKKSVHKKGVENDFTLQNFFIIGSYFETMIVAVALMVNTNPAEA